MDKLTKGTWIVNTIKHLSDVRQDTLELDLFGATEQAGKAGLLLSRLASDQQEIVDFGKLRVYARQSSISPAEIKSYLNYLRGEGKVDFITDEQGNVKETEIYCFSSKDAIETASQLYEKFEPTPVENASIVGLQATFELPRFSTEFLEVLTQQGIAESVAKDTLSLQRTFGLVKISKYDEEIIYNEYAFSGDPSSIPKALAGLSNTDRDMVSEVQHLVMDNPGFLLEAIPKHIKPEIISIMEGIGLVDGITVKSLAGEATFLTVPQLKGQGLGSFSLSEDVFHKAKILLSSLRFGQAKSSYGRGSISSSDKMFNIVNKLLRKEWVGPCTAIGQDYQLLELDGVIQTTPAEQGMYYMLLRQQEVGHLVKQILTMNKVFQVDPSIDVSLSQQPTGCTIPEVRKKEIEAKTTEPIIRLRSKMLQAIRTGR